MKKKKILVVDDSGVFRKLIVKELGIPEFELEECSNGDEALKKIKEEKYDLITLDVEMPVMNGFEACQAIRDYEAEQAIDSPTPVVFLTSKDRTQDRDKGFESGGNDFVSKNFNKGELLYRVLSLISPKKRFSVLKVVSLITTERIFRNCKAILSEESIKLERTSSGSELLNYFDNVPSTHLIIIEDNGNEEQMTSLLNELKNKVSSAGVPIILLNKDATEDEKLERYKSGVSEIIEVPFLKEVFISKILNYLKIAQMQQSLYSQIAHLESLAAEKQMALAKCSHDIRNPLGNILGFSELLLLGQVNKEEETKYVNLIKNESQNLMDLVEELLDQSKGDKLLDLEEVALDDLIETVVENFTARAKEKQIELKLKVGRFGSYKVSASWNHLIRCFNNLLSNAIKFSYPQSVIEIEIRTVRKTILVGVKDFGMGVPDSLQGKIFEPFNDAGRAGTQNEKSNGLGLSIVKQIIESHHGKITLKSEENKGTTFIVSLPEYSVTVS